MIDDKINHLIAKKIFKIKDPIICKNYTADITQAREALIESLNEIDRLQELLTQFEFTKGKLKELHDYNKHDLIIENDKLKGELSAYRSGANDSVWKAKYEFVKGALEQEQEKVAKAVEWIDGCWVANRGEWPYDNGLAIFCDAVEKRDILKELKDE